MTEPIQRILVGRALAGEHPRYPEQIIEWLEDAARDGIGTRHHLIGAVGALCDECATESDAMPWEVAETAREG
jgi:hypothetical protein